MPAVWGIRNRRFNQGTMIAPTNFPGPYVACTKCGRATPLAHAYDYHGVVWCRRAGCKEEYRQLQRVGVLPK